MESQLALIDQSLNTRYSPWARVALDGLSDNFTITDPHIPGNPIVFASSGFLNMSGYSKDEVIGSNGRMFQGPLTDRKSVVEIGDAVREEREFKIHLLNYRKDGTPFWMLFHVSPVFEKEDGRAIHFIAVQVPILGERSFSGFGSCRREVCSDSLVYPGRVLHFDSAIGGLTIEKPCEAEKGRGSTAINNILSVLIHYSESTGKLVCGKRCSLPGASFISLSLNLSLGRIKQSFVLTDPHLPDLPIVYASDAFLKLTGHSWHEVLGRNCRFLRGEDTDSADIEKIKKSVQAEQACTVRILNYRKNKTTFWNLLHISPVRNASGKIAYIVGVQIEEGSKSQDRHGLCAEMRQLSCVGAVRVAVRTSSIAAASSKS